MVFVNSMDVAHDLFEMKSSLYSDRFQFTMMNELYVWPVSSVCQILCKLVQPQDRI
jgi:hypothetical protein